MAISTARRTRNGLLDRGIHFQRFHSAVMHGGDAQPHQHRADQQTRGCHLLRAQHTETEIGGGQRGQEGEQGPLQVIRERGIEMEGQHADEVHGPDGYRQCEHAGQHPDFFSSADGFPHPVGMRQCRQRTDHGDGDGQQDSKRAPVNRHDAGCCCSRPTHDTRYPRVPTPASVELIFTKKRFNFAHSSALYRVPAMSSFNINLHEAIYSLSDALDLVGVTHIHHGKRVAFMATEVAKMLRWNTEQLNDLFQASILHDSGVSRTAVHAKLVQLEWEMESDHCQIGSNLLGACPLLAHLAPYVRYHHTHWSELQNLDIPDIVALSANCIYMVDRVDILALKYLGGDSDILLGMDEIRNTIKDKRGDWFHPDLVDAFLEVSSSEAFWFSLENNSLNGNNYASSWLSQTQATSMSFAKLRSLVHIFSSIVDAKSSFTREHSDGVAALSRYLGELFELDESSCDMLELAGMLHDIGKLRVPDDLLEKPGKLTDTEMTTMRRHSFDTYNILKNIKGMEKITLWAAQHHERIDGSGYPYHSSEVHLSLEARIVAVADVFQALAQRRPYRDSLPPQEILSIIKQQVDAGKLDAKVVKVVEDNLDSCWEASMSSLV